MALIIKEVKLEVSKPNLIQAIVAKQNDCNSRFLKASLWDEGVQIPIRATSQVTINAERKDGASDSFFGEVNEDNTVTVPLHSWMLELEGIVNCDVSIIVDDRKLTTTSFVVSVEKASNGSDDISGDPQYDVLVDLINQVNELKNGGGGGSAGENGATFTPYVSSDGTLSWTNNKGLENPAPVNIKGEKGEQGENGSTVIPYISPDGELTWECNDGSIPLPSPVRIVGEDGYTPQKHIDYFTDSDINYIVDKVCERIGDGNEVAY